MLKAMTKKEMKKIISKYDLSDENPNKWRDWSEMMQKILGPAFESIKDVPNKVRRD